MNVAALEGVVPVLPTPLTEDLQIDEAGVRHLVRFCVERGFSSLVVLGSTGEFPYLSFDEKQRVMTIAAEEASGRIPVIGTASAMGTSEAVALARAAKAAGCQAVMAAVPLYFQLGLDAILGQLATIAREGGLPTFYYHYPDVTGLVLPPHAFEAIAGVDGVIGAKVTVTNECFLRKVIERTRSSEFRVFAGTSFLLACCLESEGAGVFCPLPLLAPDEVTALVAASRRGDRREARRIETGLLGAAPILSGLSLPVPVQKWAFRLLSRAPYRVGRRPVSTVGLVKEALRLRGHPITTAVRPPCSPLDEAQRRLVRRTLDRLGWTHEAAVRDRLPGTRRSKG